MFCRLFKSPGGSTDAKHPAFEQKPKALAFRTNRVPTLRSSAVDLCTTPCCATCVLDLCKLSAAESPNKSREDAGRHTEKPGIALTRISIPPVGIVN